MSSKTKRNGSDWLGEGRDKRLSAIRGYRGRTHSAQGICFVIGQEAHRLVGLNDMHTLGKKVVLLHISTFGYHFKLLIPEFVKF